MNKSHLLPLVIFGTLLITAFALAVIISVVIHKQRQVKNKLARQRMSFEHSQSLLNTRIEVRESTLNMLAQELHDNITQAMTGCYMGLNAASLYMQNTEGKQMMQEVKEQLDNAIKDVRLLSHSLASGMVEQRELHEAIQAELMRIGAFTGTITNLEHDTLTELPPDKRLLLFRASQEALQNIVKHARANRIDVHIGSDSQYYYLTIKDDGCGFDTTALKRESFGLTSIRQRIEMLQGSLDVLSAPDAGTTIKIRIPLNPVHE